MKLILCTLALALAGCADPIVLPGPAPEFELGVGDVAILQGYGVTVRFEGVTSDSRCPIDVTCVWAGDAEASLRLAVNGESDTLVTLHTTLDDRSVVTGGLRLSLVGLSPAPTESAVIDPSSYRLRLRAEAE
jgi:hypothetical protein